MRILRSSPAWLFAITATLASCLACTMVTVMTPAGTSFQAEVAFHGQPMQRIKVTLSSAKDSRQLASSVTGKDGLAPFRNIPPGTYYLRSGNLEDKYIEVKTGGPARVAMHPIAAERGPITARSLQGVLYGPDFLPGQPRTTLTVELRDARTSRLLDQTQTTPTGEFSFPAAKPGSYLLRLNRAGQTIAPPVAVDIHPNAPAKDLILEFGEGGCGPWYFDQSKCSRPGILASQLTGQVTDSRGASIPYATIQLFDHQSNKLIESIRSDNIGHFQSPRPLSGVYELLVTWPGFTPFHTTLRTEATSSDTLLHPPITIRLGVGGACSTAIQTE